MTLFSHPDHSFSKPLLKSVSLFIIFMSKSQKTSKKRDPPNLAFFALFQNRYIAIPNGETAFLGLFSVGGTLKKRS